jgi:hypothetical protein
VDKVLNLVETQGLAVVIAVLFLYTLFKAINIMLDRLKKKSKEEQHDILLDVRKKVGEDIEDILNYAMLRANACRAYVFEYHNGVTSLGGLPFLKMSNTYEVVNAGVQSNQSTLMDLPCLLYQKLIRALDLNPYVFLNVNDRKEEYGQLVYEMMVEQGVTQAILFRFVDKKNRTAGFVGLDYACTEPKCTEGTIEIVRELAAKIGVLLAIV